MRVLKSGKEKYQVTCRCEALLEYRGSDIRMYDDGESYIKCMECGEWKCFQNFAQWYDENKYECDGEKMHIDKDILYKGNEIYSPETCIIVPKRINMLFIKRQNHRGNCCIGVSYKKQTNRYYASISIEAKPVSLGSFNSEIDAFETYKTAKEKHIKNMADRYKDKIPKQLYEALYKYKVEITD